MILCCFTGCVVAVMGVYLDRNLFELAALVAGLTGPVTGAKVWQKEKENDTDIELDKICKHPDPS